MSAIASEAYKRYFVNADWQEKPLHSFGCLNPNQDEFGLPFGDVVVTEVLLFNPTRKEIFGRKQTSRRLHQYQRIEINLDSHVSKQPAVQLTKTFEECLEQWKEATKLASSINTIILQKSYQRIIGLGADALPLIFREYQKNGGHWHHALEAITGENPIPEDCVGRAKKIKEIWMKWASDKGYL